MDEEIMDSASVWDNRKIPEQPPKEKMNKPKILPKWPLLLLLWLVGAVPELILHFYSSKGGTTLWNCGVYFPVLMAMVPAACRLVISTSRRDKTAMDFFTVLGISCNFRSRKILCPLLFNSFTMAGPSA